MSRQGLGRGQGKGYKNIVGRDPHIHSQSAKGMKQPQRVSYIRVPYEEKIFLISNTNTLNLNELKREKPLSYAYFMLDRNLDNSGMQLNFIKQDKNRVYFTVKNNINKKTSPVMELSNNELLHMNMYDVASIKDEVWGN